MAASFVPFVHVNGGSATFFWRSNEWCKMDENKNELKSYQQESETVTLHFIYLVPTYLYYYYSLRIVRKLQNVTTLLSIHPQTLSPFLSNDYSFLLLYYHLFLATPFIAVHKNTYHRGALSIHFILKLFNFYGFISNPLPHRADA
uniref:Uncharacterized protein n=1 Tax=Anopheles culicifacies TaxID=139723 RepID=A0A182MT44_9DIPT